MTTLSYYRIASALLFWGGLVLFWWALGWKAILALVMIGAGLAIHWGINKVEALQVIARREK